MWSVSLVGWRAFKARAVPHTERGNGGQCDPPGQGRSSVPRRTGDKSVTRRCEPVESGPPAVSGPSEESVVTESGERSREKERHSPFDKLGRVLRRDGSASSIGFRSRSSSQASTASKAHSQQVSPTRLSSGGEKSLVDPVEGTPLTAWRPLSRPILREEDVGNTSSSSVDVSTCSERGSIRYPTSGVTRPETPRAAKRSRQEGSNSGSPTSGPPLARRGRIRTPSTGQRREPVVVVEKMDLAEFLMRSGDSASGSADPPEVPMGGESRATKTCSRKAHKSGSSHSSRGTDSTSVNVAKDRPYKELGTASESDECEEATTVHHRGEQYVSIRAGLAAGAPSDALKDVLDWEREIVSECDSIINTARKSANLKGTSVKSLKGSATKIKGALANVCDALYPEEIRTLKANNTRLQEDVNRMRKEIEELKVELRVARLRPPTSPSQSPSEVARRVKEDERERNFHASVMASVRNLLDASLDGIRRRLPPEECLRPPLASDRVEKGPSSANVTPAAAVDLSAAPLPRREKVGRRKQTSKSGGPETGEGVSSSLSTAPPAPSQGASAEPPNSHSKEQEWTLVTSKKKEKAKRRKEQAAGTKQPVTEMPPKKKRGKKTSAKREQSAPPKTPRSLAVMISIRPDAAEKPSFAEVLGKVKSQCNLADLGIESGAKFRTTMSGGRLLQLPNSVGEEKVEQLAQKLRELLPEEMKVTRPVITAEVLVRGLDESVSKEEVRAAIATKCECHPDNIKSGGVRLILGSSRDDPLNASDVGSRDTLGRSVPLRLTAARYATAAASPAMWRRPALKGRIAWCAPTRIGRRTMLWGATDVSRHAKEEEMRLRPLSRTRRR
ncbi:hypothetical protein ACJJTC_000181 [Scirpophaga incertulas]